MSTWLNLVVALVSAVIGGVISPHLLGSRERRAARAKVLEIVRQTEHVWRQVVMDAYNEPSVPTRKIEAAITEIELAAMIARVPQPVIANYASALRAVERHPCQKASSAGGSSTMMQVERLLVERLLEDTPHRADLPPVAPRRGTLRRFVTASRLRSSPG